MIPPDIIQPAIHPIMGERAEEFDKLNGLGEICDNSLLAIGILGCTRLSSAPPNDFQGRMKTLSQVTYDLSNPPFDSDKIPVTCDERAQLVALTYNINRIPAYARPVFYRGNDNRYYHSWIVQYYARSEFQDGWVILDVHSNGHSQSMEKQVLDSDNGLGKHFYTPAYFQKFILPQNPEFGDDSSVNPESCLGMLTVVDALSVTGNQPLMREINSIMQGEVMDETHREQLRQLHEAMLEDLSDTGRIRELIKTYIDKLANYRKQEYE